MASSLVLFGLCGCGGGGGGETGGGALNTAPFVAPLATLETPAANPESPAPAAVSYTPNYVPSLAATRRWDRKNVTVAVIMPPAGSAKTSSDRVALVQQAIELWKNKVGQDIQFQLATGTPGTGTDADADADVTISWVPAGSLPSDAIGRTVVQFRTYDQVLLSARVSVTQTLPDNFQVQVIAHELGHALGIDGHSASSGDLMYANSHLPAVVTASDQNTVLWTYQVGPTRSLTRSSTASSISTAESICGLTK